MPKANSDSFCSSTFFLYIYFILSNKLGIFHCLNFGINFDKKNEVYDAYIYWCDALMLINTIFFTGLIRLLWGTSKNLLLIYGKTKFVIINSNLLLLNWKTEKEKTLNRCYDVTV